MKPARKCCTKCGEEKSASEFYERGDRDGLRAHCKDCSKRTKRQQDRRNAQRALRPERAIRLSIIQRCHNPRNPAFASYGGRGIRVCETWRGSFDAFLADVGRRPGPEFSVERIDNDRGYEPGNCRWATRTEQNRNTRQNVLITIDGVTKCRAAWAAAQGVSGNLIRDRMQKLGWDARRAVFTPPDVRFGPRRAA